MNILAELLSCPSEVTGKPLDDAPRDPKAYNTYMGQRVHEYQDSCAKYIKGKHTDVAKVYASLGNGFIDETALDVIVSCRVTDVNGKETYYTKEVS